MTATGGQWETGFEYTHLIEYPEKSSIDVWRYRPESPLVQVITRTNDEYFCPSNHENKKFNWNDLFFNQANAFEILPAKCERFCPGIDVLKDKVLLWWHI